MQAGANVEAVAKGSKGSNGNGMTPLLTACKMGCAEVVQALLDGRADVNKAGDDGATPLLTASRLGFRVVVQRLVKAEADLEKASMGGETPLLGAVRERKSEVVVLLLKAGARTLSNLQDSFEPNPT